LKQKIILLFVSIPLILLLAYLLMDQVHRYILAPILYAFRIERILYDVLPQSVCWGFFLFVLTVIAVRSLFRGRQYSSMIVESPKEERMSRARSWVRWIEMSRRGNYSKWLLARHFADLVSNILAYQERQTLERIQARLLNNQEDIPPDIRDYLQVGLNMPSFRHYSEFLGGKHWLSLSGRWLSIHNIGNKPRFKSILPTSSTIHEGINLKATPLNLDPEVIIQFLETKIPTGGSL
jgi:AraC-like DNA-binding protein